MRLGLEARGSALEAGAAPVEVIGARVQLGDGRNDAPAFHRRFGVARRPTASGSWGAGGMRIAIPIFDGLIALDAMGCQPTVRADASCRGGIRRAESVPAWVGFAARLLLVPSLERAAWWSVRRAQNRKPATYRCPLCGSYLPALVEHVLIAPEGKSAGRRHAHTHCVLQARRAGRLPTREDWQRTQPRRPSRWRRLLRFGRGGT